ncbi:MAG TPA: hypothetical protein VL970_00245 [Candidatus Acidoferrales bacterium]|nr:hypothetical protein [Candidatus Acidoferrales bacterium]
MRDLRDQAGQIARIVCLVLAGLILYELAGTVLRWNPFHGVTVPALPALAAVTNAPPVTTHAPKLLATGGIKGTNQPPKTAATNSSPPVAAAQTNSTPIGSAGKETHSIIRAESKVIGTNTITNALASTVANASTNVATNRIAKLEAKAGNGTNPTPAMLASNDRTNLLAAGARTGTNAASGAVSPRGAPSPAANPAMLGVGFNPMQPPGAGAPLLPPAIRARIAKITESEILAPVVHPMPMALLGIAGEFAFLRATSGQTGLVKEGDTLGDIKLLRIGINRVLVEQGGQKSELMIFSGYGGESLMPKDTFNETNHP